MSLEEKVGQLLIVHFHGERANSESDVLLNEAKVGGFIFYNWCNSLSSPKQVAELCTSLQQQNPSALPLFLGVDQEGGRVQRLKEGFFVAPSQRESAKQGTVAQTAETVAKELKTSGINLNFAPVVDVDSNPNNPIIGDRAYSNDPQVVAKCALAALKAYSEQNILTAIKHFPGHGDVTIDSHSALPRVDKSFEQLQKIELFPFRELLASAPMMMTAHIIFSDLDPDNPATFSKKILTELLRDEWGYQGVVISDSLLMKALYSHCDTPEEAALTALLAGCDLICLGGKLLNESIQDELNLEDVLRIHRYIVASVRSGKYSEAALDKSIERIRRAKITLL